MKPDLNNREQIERMVNTFYEKVKVDDLIGHFFNEVIKVDWNNHLPLMYNFWESILSGSNSYSGNPIEKHLNVHHLSPMKKAHFDRWLDIFIQNLDENFEGIKTEIARQRALSIATVMQLKTGNG